MKRKSIPHFYAINWNPNRDNLEFYDVMPYFIDCWNKEKKLKRKLWNLNYDKEKDSKVDRTKMPETFEEYKKFLLDNSMYMFWARCEYEVIVTGWPPQKNKVKLDIHKQVEQNIDIIVKVFIDYTSK